MIKLQPATDPTNISVGALVPLTKKAAKHLTNSIRQGIDFLWKLLREAHDGKAWSALGYSTWEAYVAAEFGMSRQRSHQILDQGRVIEAVRSATGDLSTTVDITERQARDIKEDLPAVTEEVRVRVEQGQDPKEAVAETIAAKRAEKQKAKEKRAAEKAENDAFRDQHREALPEAVKQQEAAKQAAKETRKAGADIAVEVETATDRIAELEEAVGALEADNEALKAENKLYGEMRVQFEQGGFEKVVAGKNEEIRVLQTRVYGESADKASWMKSAKFWKAEAIKLGYSSDTTIDIETGEVIDG